MGQVGDDWAKNFNVNLDEPFTLTKTVKKASRKSSEEQLMILQMLQEKKISVEDAEKLLDALGK
jgi:hypothetical protein